MIYTVSGWRYWYRRYCGWIPIQFCMICGRWYWGGLPRFWITNKVAGQKTNNYEGNIYQTPIYKKGIGATWLPSWKDYCSQKCCDDDGTAIDKYFESIRK